MRSGSISHGSSEGYGFGSPQHCFGDPVDSGQAGCPKGVAADDEGETARRSNWQFPKG